MIVRFCQIVEQKLENHGAAKTAAFQLEVGKTQGKIDCLNIADAEKAGVFHCPGKTVAIR